MIELLNVSKSYNNKDKVIDNISLSIEKGEFVTILGPSGCGKTTLLKLINKLIDFDKGDILVNNKSVRQWDTIKLRRNIGYVIQQVGLFPHMKIEDNISFVLTLMKENQCDKNNKVNSLLKLVGLDSNLASRYPRELSGGQRQRVGVARALAANPDVILMDEPFSAVDEIARKHLQEEIKTIHKKLSNTIVFVTHDIEEALKLGSKIIIIRDGRIEQVGTKEDVIFNPANSFVKEFIGLKGLKAMINEKIMMKIYKDIIKSNKSNSC